MRKTINWVGLILLAFSLQTCGLLDRFMDPVQRAVRVIDTGIEDIQSESASWRTVLRQVADDLPDQVSETIRVDAQELVARSVATTGTEIRCNTDFLGNRAIAYLQRLKAKLLKQPLPALPPPVFCQIVPDNLALSIEPEKWERLTLYGYDLDHRDGANALFKVFLLAEAGQRIELPENRIGRTTHYQVTINLGGMAKELYQKKIVKLVTSWADAAGGSEVVIIPWQARQRVEEVNVARTTYMPPHTRGDRDFDTDDDEPTDVEMHGQFNRTEDFVDSRVYLKAREREPDHTTAEGWSDWARAYTAPPNWRIVDINPGVNSAHAAAITDHGEKTYHRPGGEVVSHFVVWCDRRGDDAGVYTQVEANWRVLRVALQEKSPAWLQ